MIQHTLFFPFIQHSVNRQEIIGINRTDYDNYIHKYNSHNCFVQY